MPKLVRRKGRMLQIWSEAHQLQWGRWRQGWWLDLRTCCPTACAIFMYCLLLKDHILLCVCIGLLSRTFLWRITFSPIHFFVTHYVLSSLRTPANLRRFLSRRGVPSVAALRQWDRRGEGVGSDSALVHIRVVCPTRGLTGAWRFFFFYAWQVPSALLCCGVSGLPSSQRYRHSYTPNNISLASTSQ